MNKSEIARKYAEKADIPYHVAAMHVNGILDVMGEAIASEGKLTLSDFGTFNVTTRKAFTGSNPRTGAPIAVPSVKVPVFKVGRGLKERINQ
jgi:DNA-binding protein HU-beta